MAISMLKIRRPLGRLIFNMGIAIPGKTVFLIETAPCACYVAVIYVTPDTLASAYVSVLLRKVQRIFMIDLLLLTLYNLNKIPIYKKVFLCRYISMVVVALHTKQ